jgi:hypothetical protein
MILPATPLAAAGFEAECTRKYDLKIYRAFIATLREVRPGAAYAVRAGREGRTLLRTASERLPGCAGRPVKSGRLGAGLT